ncbi:glycoside hydrolase family 3 C-terminal domain-containing protein [Streptomyces justiciae]|uniref:glycoside hydrolase family 3 C-terminal domain-containing protein n=1 Tax=Streptomyces justiciae TaxID=2780140 RepID=UPI0021196159|nr:glycoside hydrolase family 3 C-terminal domain-containing protein [Streptomyces justiciae]MCW8379765.1 glycoside hydrolase family 3 C-terminal domain-containing protein [Streptomyces justiciae]
MTHPYRDPERTVRERVADLLPRMTLEDKAGLLFHHAIGIGERPAPAGRTAEQMMAESGMTHFNLLGAGSPREIVALHNRLQEAAADSRLGIPVTFSTDPRHAGADQIGGESCPELIVDLVRTGRLDESRLDESVARLLAEKFRLGLFDDQRYVDADIAEETVGRADFRTEREAAQRRSSTLLKNGPSPLSGRPRLFVDGVSPEVASEYADVVTDPATADFAVLRLATPYERRPGLFESFFHAGRLDFPEERLKEILGLLDVVPAIVVIHLERPAVIPEIADRSAGLLAVFGAGDRAVLDVLFGRALPEGRLPFQLPRSMAEVVAGRPDVPQESTDPLFAFDHGLSFPLGP